MRMSLLCEVEHALPQPTAAHGLRVQLERGLCPVCPGHELEGEAFGGLEWAHCPCCESDWRLDPEGFALRPGRIIEEWA